MGLGHGFVSVQVLLLHVVAGNKLNVENNTKMSFQARLTTRAQFTLYVEDYGTTEQSCAKGDSYNCSRPRVGGCCAA